MRSRWDARGCRAGGRARAQNPTPPRARPGRASARNGRAGRHRGNVQKPSKCAPSSPVVPANRARGPGRPFLAGAPNTLEQRSPNTLEQPSNKAPSSPPVVPVVRCPARATTRGTQGRDQANLFRAPPSGHPSDTMPRTRARPLRLSGGHPLDTRGHPADGLRMPRDTPRDGLRMPRRLTQIAEGFAVPPVSGTPRGPFFRSSAPSSPSTRPWSTGRAAPRSCVCV